MITKKAIKTVIGERTANYLSEKISRLKYCTWSHSRNGQASKARLNALRNSYAGRRCFVIGNGPSLNQIDIKLLEGELSIGSNGIYMMTARNGFSPTFYTVEDVRVAHDTASEIKKYSGPIKLFPYDLRDVLVSDSEIDTSLWYHFSRRIYTDEPEFSRDLSSLAHWGGSVTFLNIQLAVFLGCNPIILVGVDHRFETPLSDRHGALWVSRANDSNHFAKGYFRDGTLFNAPNIPLMNGAYAAAARFGRENNIVIQNATVGGNLEAFPRVEFSKLFR